MLETDALIKRGIVIGFLLLASSIGFTDILRSFVGRGNPLRGGSVFTEKVCYLCHSLAGKGKVN